MVTVIKEGALPVIIYFGTCKTCGCEVSAHYEDHEAGWTPSRHRNSIIQVNCPTEKCGNKIACRQKKEEKV